MSRVCTQCTALEARVRLLEERLAQAEARLAAIEGNGTRTAQSESPAGSDGWATGHSTEGHEGSAAAAPSSSGRGTRPAKGGVPPTASPNLFSPPLTAGERLKGYLVLAAPEKRQLGLYQERWATFAPRLGLQLGKLHGSDVYQTEVTSRKQAVDLWFYQDLEFPIPIRL